MNKLELERNLEQALKYLNDMNDFICEADNTTVDNGDYLDRWSNRVCDFLSNLEGEMEKEECEYCGILTTETDEDNTPCCKDRRACIQRIQEEDEAELVAQNA